MDFWNSIKHFEPHEFESPDEKGSGYEMNKQHILRLDMARKFADIPFKVNSGYRTEIHNKKVGGSPTSSHLKGLATDIHCPSPQLRWVMVKALLDAGFKRILIYNTFIHVDSDQTKVQPILKLMS